jgi:hypothetical protein
LAYNEDIRRSESRKKELDELKQLSNQGKKSREMKLVVVSESYKRLDTFFRKGKKVELDKRE